MTTQKKTLEKIIPILYTKEDIAEFCAEWWVQEYNGKRTPYNQMMMALKPSHMKEPSLTSQHIFKKTLTEELLFVLNKPDFEGLTLEHDDDNPSRPAHLPHSNKLQALFSVDNNNILDLAANLANVPNENRSPSKLKIDRSGIHAYSVNEQEWEQLAKVDNTMFKSQSAKLKNTLTVADGNIATSLTNGL